MASRDSSQLMMNSMVKKTAILKGSTAIICRLTVAARRTAVTSLSTMDDISAVFWRSK